MRWLLVIALVGCTSSPSDSTQCETLTVTFRHDISGPSPSAPLPTLAVGGTLEVAPQCRPASNYPEDYIPLDVPYSAVIDGDPAAVITSSADGRITLHGAHDGTSTLRIVGEDHTTYGSVAIAVRSIDHIALGPSGGDEAPPDIDLAFSTELATVARVQLAAADGLRLADDDLVITAPGTSQFLPDAISYSGIAPGNYTVEATSGTTPYSAPFIVVDHADSIALVNPSVTIASGGTTVCFGAILGTRFVTGLRWAYMIDGFSTGGDNCQHVDPAEDTNHDGAIAFTASAGGQSIQASVPIQ
jgi:hypothetical protein